MHEIFSQKTAVCKAHMSSTDPRCYECVLDMIKYKSNASFYMDITKAVDLIIGSKRIEEHKIGFFCQPTDDVKEFLFDTLMVQFIDLRNQSGYALFSKISVLAGTSTFLILNRDQQHVIENVKTNYKNKEYRYAWPFEASVIFA